MTSLKNLRLFFRPIQPAVKEDDQKINYTEWIPDRQLQNYIFCYWQLKTNSTLAEDYKYRVVSDGCIDIFFNLHELTESFIMGFSKKYVEFPIGKDFNYVGIRFLPSIFPLLFSISANELVNKDQWLKDILPDWAEWIKNSFLKSMTKEDLKIKFDNHLLQHVKDRVLNTDQRFYDALDYMLGCKGHVDIESDLKTGLSPRQLRRIFNYFIGTSPKSFCKVVRFQYILSQNLKNQSLTDSKCYLDVGYYDQAHFIKDFKTFYGVTPKVALH